jgi:hypothetical protein
MRVTRLIAGVGVGGIVTFGAMAPASAGGPLVSIGHGTSGAVVNVLPVHDSGHVRTVTVESSGDLLAKVKIGGHAPSSDGNLANALADPLPVKVCLLCESENDDQALA